MLGGEMPKAYRWIIKKNLAHRLGLKSQLIDACIEMQFKL